MSLSRFLFSSLDSRLRGNDGGGAGMTEVGGGNDGTLSA